MNAPNQEESKPDESIINTQEQVDPANEKELNGDANSKSVSSLNGSDPNKTAENGSVAETSDPETSTVDSNKPSQDPRKSAVGESASMETPAIENHPPDASAKETIQTVPDSNKAPVPEASSEDMDKSDQSEIDPSNREDISIDEKEKEKKLRKGPIGQGHKKTSQFDPKTIPFSSGKFRDVGYLENLDLSQKSEFSQKINNFFHYSSQEEHVEKSEEKISEEDKDPTNPYAIQRNFTLTMDAAELHHHYKKLIEGNIVLISCHDRDVSISAADKLINLDAFKSFEKRMLLLANSLDDKPGVIWDKLSTMQFAWKNDSIVMMEAFRSPVKRLLGDHIFNPLSTGVIVKTLKSYHRFLVCVIDKEELDQLLSKSDGVAPKLYIWSIDALEHILSSDYENPGSLKKIIREQQKRGLWGRTEKQLIIEVRKCHNDGSLERTIQSKSAIAQKSVDPAAPLVKSEDFRARDLFKNASILERIVLFTAAYFPGVTFEDFNRIVLLLLSDQIRTEFRESKIIHEDGSEEIKETPYEIPLREDWEMDEDEIMENLHIGVRNDYTGYEKIDFTHQSLRADLIRIINEKPSFLRKQAQIVRYSNLFFLDQEADIELLDNVTRLMVLMAKKNPREYGREWLANLVINLARRGDNIQLRDDSFMSFLEMLSKVALDKIRKDFFLKCVARMIREMTNHDFLLPMVNDFFGDLSNGGYHEELIDIISFFNHSSEIDELQWMKRLTRNTSFDPQTQNRVRMFLQSYLRKIPNLFDNIERLTEWLSREHNANGSMDAVGSMAFNSLVDLLLNSINEVKDFQYGLWPSRYLLFRWINPEQPSDHLSVIFDFFTHPGLEDILKARIKRLKRFVATEWMIPPTMEGLNYPSTSFICILCIDGFMDEINAGRNRVNSSKNYAALLASLIIGKWRIILQGDIGKTMTAEAENLSQSIRDCFVDLDEEFKSYIFYYWRVLNKYLKMESRELIDRLKAKHCPDPIWMKIKKEILDRIAFLKEVEMHFVEKT